MGRNAHLRFKQGASRRFRLAFVTALGLVLIGFALYPRYDSEVPAGEVKEIGIQILDVETFEVPRVPEELERPKVPIVILDETVVEVASETEPLRENPLASAVHQTLDDQALLNFDRAPRPYDMVRPTYPEVARFEGTQGRVLLRLEIDEKGRVEDARVIQSDWMILNRTSVDAVKRWRFVPAQKDGRPVRSAILLPLEYHLKDQ